jgi:hypothetical protein
MVMKATRVTIQVAHYIAFDCDEIPTANNQHYENYVHRNLTTLQLEL